MMSLPNPLHPALVHFPIALILLGSAVIVVSVFVRRWHLSWAGAVLMAFGAAGALAATVTGDRDEESIGELQPKAEQVLEEHEEWGERTRNAAIVSALLAITAASLVRFPVAARTISVAAACAALAASYCVVETGHYGGQLVFKHGAGVNTAAGAAMESQAISQGESKKHHDDDD